jgi:hypothetical protein
MINAEEYKKIEDTMEILSSILEKADIEYAKFCDSIPCGGECPLFETECSTIGYLEYIESR